MNDSEYKQILKKSKYEINKLKDSESRLADENRRLLEANKSEVKRLVEIENSLQRCFGNVESLFKGKETLEHKLTEIELLVEKNEADKENLEHKLEYLKEHRPGKALNYSNGLWTS